MVSNSNAENIQIAVNLLRQGEVVGMPTETVYGLAASIQSSIGIEKIFKTKERPFFDPLIVHVSSIDQAMTLTTEWSDIAQTLAAAFWPGPLTMILPKSSLVSDMITSGMDSVGIRMPQHPVALELIKQMGVPLAAPSANKFGRTSPTNSKHVEDEFKNENIFVLEGGECQVGIESTVVLIKRLNGKGVLSILRPGALTESDLSKVLHKKALKFEFIHKVDKKESPGAMKHHYMPQIPLILIVNREYNESEILLESNLRIKELPEVIEEVRILKPQDALLSPAHLVLSTDPTVASRQFYGDLRRLAEQGADCILCRIKDPPADERWLGLYDRLKKAASLTLS